jgi:hypothetical protein
MADEKREKPAKKQEECVAKHRVTGSAEISIEQRRAEMARLDESPQQEDKPN